MARFMENYNEFNLVEYIRYLVARFYLKKFFTQFPVMSNYIQIHALCIIPIAS